MWYLICQKKRNKHRQSQINEEKTSKISGKISDLFQAGTVESKA